MGCGSSSSQSPPAHTHNNNSNTRSNHDSEDEARRRMEEERRIRDEEEERRIREEEEERARRDADAVDGDMRAAEDETRRREEEARRLAEEERIRREEEERLRAEEAERRRAVPVASIIDEEEDETPFDDDGFRDSEGYTQSALGLWVKSLDYRDKYLDDAVEPRPYVESGQLYVDHEFPLELAIVEDNSNIEWKRPQQFVENPELFTDGSTRFDVGQGSAGTCWFLSTVANIAENDAMLQQVIPRDAYNGNDGVFHARFYRFGRWEDVYVDDCLPVIYGNVLWGAKSATDEQEMWVALLEKAFAKLYGSYDAIYGGQPGDAYLLLTGGIGERIELEGQADKPNTLFRRITNAINSGCQVSCVVPDEYDKYQGLVGGHAYSLVGTEEVNRTKLVRVRNPWGHGEWTGPWSDGTREWESIPEHAVKAPNRDDGEFYVSLDDFMTYFSQTTICCLTPDMDSDGTADSLNYVLSLFGEWRQGSAGGFSKLLENPRYCFTITEEGVRENGLVPFVVQIIQQSEKRKADNISMRCDVFRVLGDTIKPVRRRMAVEIQGTKNNIYSPELQASFRHWLKPGKYIVVPSTVEPGQEKAFLLRLFSCSPLLNINQIPMDTKITSCDSETTMQASNGQVYNLSFEKTLFGEFQAGRNAGGQVSHMDSYHKNPQYRISVPNTGSDVAVVIHIMQDQEEPQYPVGIRFFKLGPDTQPPVDVKYLYDNYNESPYHEENGQSKFMISWDVDVRYLLPAGRYVALIHLDEPNTEKEFAISFKSNAHIAIKGYQT